MTRRRHALLATLCAAAMALTACANVPLETKPQSIGDASEIDNGRPDDDRLSQALTPYDVVRTFVERNALEVNDYEPARNYLEPRARKQWEPGESVIIIQDAFNTIPVQADRQPEDKNATIVRLHGKKIGVLGPDKAFIPAKDSYDTEILLRRQPDTKQWRIAELPDDVITTESEFVDNYFPVPMYFFAPDGNVRVPDQRYLPDTPKEGVPRRVVEALLEGPSDGLVKAVDNPLQNASLDTNVTVSSDGALEVPLTGIGGADKETRTRIVAQIVMSLDWVTSNRIRVLADGKPLLPNRKDWRPGDLKNYNSRVTDLPGMAVLNGRLVSLSDGNPIAGPAGIGAYQIVSAAQSLEGSQLAMVERSGKSVRLRIGETGKEASIADIEGRSLTRPTWRPAHPGNGVSTEVWTAIDGKKVVRATLSPDNVWTPQTVNTSALDKFGKITALRLSRDGTRAAIVANKKLVVAAVARTEESVRLRAPRILQPGSLTDVVDVDWLAQDSLVAATSSESRPVVMVSVDGFRLDRFNPANLETPVASITATPGASVIAANPGGLATSPDVGEVWRQHPVSQGSLTAPFYPG